MKLPRPRAIFFDLDETLLVNTVGVDQWIEAVLISAHSQPLPPSNRDEFKSALFAAADGLWEKMLTGGERGRSLMIGAFARATAQIGGDAEQAATMFECFLQTASRGTQLSANAEHVLRSLRASGIKTGIITNGIEALQQAKVSRHGLEAQTDVIVISENAGAHKPDRAVFDYALGRAGVAAQDAWHVGDHRINDIAGAIGVGMSAILYDPKPIDAAANRKTEQVPHAVITDLGQLLDLLSD